MAHRPNYNGFRCSDDSALVDTISCTIFSVLQVLWCTFFIALKQFFTENKLWAKINCFHSAVCVCLPKGFCKISSNSFEKRLYMFSHVSSLLSTNACGPILCCVPTESFGLINNSDLAKPARSTASLIRQSIFLITSRSLWIEIQCKVIKQCQSILLFSFGDTTSHRPIFPVNYAITDHTLQYSHGRLSIDFHLNKWHFEFLARSTIELLHLRHGYFFVSRVIIYYCQPVSIHSNLNRVWSKTQNSFWLNLLLT